MVWPGLFRLREGVLTTDTSKPDTGTTKAPGRQGIAVEPVVTDRA